MNNSYFCLTRYLRDAGYDATLYQFKGEPEHFTPANDCYDDSYKKYTIAWEYGHPYQLMHVPAKKIREEFGQYDFLIGSGAAPAYLNKAGMILDLFFVYGWDLYKAPFFRIHNPLYTLQYFYCLYHTRAGIRKARHMTVGDSSPMFDRLLAKLHFQGKRHMFPSPAVYEPDYNPVAIQKFYPVSKSYEQYKSIRGQHDFLVFHNTRQIWKTTSNPVAIKDNDVFFRAFKRFNEKINGKAGVVAFEYGNDYEASKQLCNELGIERNVHWLPLSSRKELMIGMSMADLVAGEFRNSWFTYGVVFEAMAACKPVMHNRNDALYANQELYPMFSASNEEEIYNQLLFAYNNPAVCRETGEGANNWYKKNAVQRTLGELSALFLEKQAVQ
jgi:glycosyltransferase involved in cell wall biosynthesis